MKLFKINFALKLSVLILSCLPTLVQAEEVLILDPLIRLDNYYDPVIEVSGVEPIFPEELKSLWLKALNRPEADYQRLAATTIVLAHRRGMTGLEDTVPRLVEMLNQEDLHPTVKLSVVDALIELDVKEQAEKLAEIAQSSGVDFQNKIEPVLAKWGYEPYQKVWQERINSNNFSRRVFLVAIQSLVKVKDESVKDRLLDLVTNQNVPSYVRIASAKGLGDLTNSGLVETANSLFQAGGFVNEYCAVNLIKNDESESATDAMRNFSMSDHSTVVKVPLEYLLKKEDLPLEKIVEKAVGLSDPEVRVLAVKGLKRFPSESKQARLFKLLSDSSYLVRREARDVLYGYTKDESFKDGITKQSRALLESEDWREIEQAIILLTLLDDKVSADQFIQFLNHQKPEVQVTSAWGLRKLAVFTTFTKLGEELISLAKQNIKILENFTKEEVRARELKASQLILLIGDLKIPFPQENLLPLVTVKLMGDESRAAAIWTLGMLNEGQQPTKVENALIDRVADTEGNVPEDQRIRRMAAVSLGRMKSENAVTTLKKYYNDGAPSNSTADWACGWALEQITGEKMAPVKPVPMEWDDWFLQPAK